MLKNRNHHGGILPKDRKADVVTEDVKTLTLLGGFHSMRLLTKTSDYRSCSMHCTAPERGWGRKGVGLERLSRRVQKKNRGPKIEFKIKTSPDYKHSLPT